MMSALQRIVLVAAILAIMTAVTVESCMDYIQSYSNSQCMPASNRQGACKIQKLYLPLYQVLEPYHASRINDSMYIRRMYSITCT